MEIVLRLLDKGLCLKQGKECFFQHQNIYGLKNGKQLNSQT